jgi:hypothetical protein
MDTLFATETMAELSARQGRIATRSPSIGIWSAPPRGVARERV